MSKEVKKIAEKKYMKELEPLKIEATKLPNLVVHFSHKENKETVVINVTVNHPYDTFEEVAYMISVQLERYLLAHFSKGLGDEGFPIGSLMSVKY